MADEKTYVFDSASSRNDVPLAYALNGNGWGNGGYGLGGWGGGILGFLLGTVFGGGWGGFGGFGGNGAGLGSMLNNDNNTDVILQAINGTDADVRQLASTLNADVNEVRSSISAIQLGIQQVASQTGMSGLEIQNAILSGNASLSRQLCEACYQNQIGNLEQTASLTGAITSNGRAITDAIAALQTNVTKEFCEVREREMQSKIETQGEIISQLRGQIDNANQTAAITSYVSSLVTPLQKEVSEIRAAQPATVSVQYPNLVAVNNTPYTGGFGSYPYYSGYPYYGTGSIWA